jgi:hypothetical protein
MIHQQTRAAGLQSASAAKDATVTLDLTEKQLGAGHPAYPRAWLNLVQAQSDAARTRVVSHPDALSE